VTFIRSRASCANNAHARRYPQAQRSGRRDDLRWFRLRVAHMARPQNLIQDDGAQGPKPQVVDLKGSDLQICPTGGQDQRDCGHGEVRTLREIDPRVDPDLRADDRDQPKQVELDPAKNADRDAQHEGTELRDEAQQDGCDCGDDEYPDREDPGNAHDADVLGVRGLPGATEYGADDRGQTVAHERTAQVAGQV